MGYNGTRIERKDMIGWEKMIQKPSLNDTKGLTNIKQCQDRSFTSKSRMREFMMAEIEDFKGTILLSSIFKYILSSLLSYGFFESRGHFFYFISP